MNERGDWRLIRQYVETGSESAFAELAKRYSGLVYGTCLKELRDHALAEDAAQVVFIILARRARTFRSEIVLAAWLFETCRFTAKNMRRDERRRRMREEKMADEARSNAMSSKRQDDTGELLYEAICSLPRADRQAVLLHHVCGYSFVETGAMTSVSEEAARKRVARALLKLKQRLLQMGTVVTVIGIAELLDTRIAAALPPSAVSQLASSSLIHPRRLLRGWTGLHS